MQGRLFLFKVIKFCCNSKRLRFISTRFVLFGTQGKMDKIKRWNSKQPVGLTVYCSIFINMLL